MAVTPLQLGLVTIAQKVFDDPLILDGTQMLITETHKGFSVKTSDGQIRNVKTIGNVLQIFFQFWEQHE